MGYSNVVTFRGGIPAWVKAGYKLDMSNALPKAKVPRLKAKELLSMQSEVLIVDIRTEKLYAFGWIKDSMKIPMEFLSKSYSKIPQGKKIVIVDHAGKQTLNACKFLISKGYDDVSRLQGGLLDWNTKGYTLEK